MRVWMCAVAAAAIAAGGCVEVAVGPTPYFANPQQPDSPRGDIPGGTALWVLWKQDGYSQVVTPEGEAAWVWSRLLVTPEEWEKIRQSMAGNPDGSLMFGDEPSSPGEWQLYYGDTRPAGPQPVPSPGAQPGARPAVEPGAPPAAEQAPPVVEPGARPRATRGPAAPPGAQPAARPAP